MQITLDKNAENKIISFTKYAQFISNKFGITVEFDGVKAHTDGNVITLPNLLGMSNKEIDFLYCVLLHEVGHIKYSSFTKEDFAMIKTSAHFELANAIEDARIENLLMNEYDGAHDIFISLYNEFAFDKNFMKKVFGFTHDNVDDFKSLTTYLHYHLVDLGEKKSLKEIMGAKSSKKLENFVKDNKIDELLKKASLNDWKDVVKLSNKIYDLFFANKKDNSEKNTLPLMEEVADDSLNNTIAEIEKRAKDYNDKISKLSKKMNSLKTEAETIKNSNKDALEVLEKEYNDKIAQAEEIDSYLQNLEEMDHSKNQVNNLQKKKESKEEKLKRYEDKIKSLSEKLAQEQDEEKKKALEDKIKTQQEFMAKQDALQKKYSEKFSKESESLLKVEQDLLNQIPKFANMTEEQLTEQYNNLNKQLSDLRQQINDLKQGLTEKNRQIKDVQDQVKEIKKNMSQDFMQEINSMQEKFDQAGIPIDLLPKFDELEGWEEANNIQKDFDTRASSESGDMVTNGCGFGQGSRDILSLIEKAKSNLQELDLAKIFKEKHNVSKLDELNDFSQINKTNEENSIGEIYSSKRKHIPLTTKFDKITNKTNGSMKDLNTIRQKNSLFLKQLKELIKLKMKSQKKDRFKGGQEEGQLDARNLWKLATKTDDNYYEINKPRHINNVVASIAIDVSGSMDKDYTEKGEKIKELALMLSDSLSEAFIKHEVIGYHAPISHEMRAIQKSPVFNRNSNSLEHIIYRQFNDKGNLGISNLELNCTDNCDGESLKFISHRLIRERAKRRILFVLTDGKPFVSDSDIDVLDQDLKNTLQWCKQNKVEVYAISFNEHGKQFYENNFWLVKHYPDLLNHIKNKL